MRRENMMTLMMRAVVLLLPFMPAVAYGWGADGHRIVGEVGSHHLSPAAKANVKALLRDKSLTDVSTWADQIRGNSAYRWASPFHYANVKPEAKRFNLKRDCPKRGCVVSAIIKYRGVLLDKDASYADKSEALKFLVHFVGDIHQPLHVSHARDKGGNDIKVEFFHDRTNLHKVWDSGLLRRSKKRWRDHAKELRERITPEQARTWGESRNPSDWATESYRLALSHAYEIPKDGRIEAEYYDRNIPVIEERLQIAGVRLASLLNAILTGPPVASAPANPVTPPESAHYVGSRRSGVYHYPTCPVVNRIKASNLIEYESVPSGKRLHKGCRP